MKVVILISVCQQGFSKSCPYTFPELFAELTCQEGIPARHFKGQLFRRSAVIPKAIGLELGLGLVGLWLVWLLLVGLGLTVSRVRSKN